MIVVDASVVLEVLLQTTAANRIAAKIFASGVTLHAPHLMDVEVAQALRRYARSGVISSARGAEALGILADLPISRYSHSMLLARIWELRHNLTAYDAVYLALAEALDAPLITRDRALMAARTRAHVDLI